jgi:conjugal transfer ATP-binding protein TraC
MEKVYKKLEFRKGEYSEVLVVLRGGTGLVGGVLRNRVTPLEYWTYTTDQNDKAKRARAVEKYGNLKDAITALARGEVV